MLTHCFVDANHAVNTVTWRSQTGILILCKRAPIIWHSKRQNTVETSTFGSEITAMKNAVDLIEALRYKLRMFGVPIEGPTNIYCDNEAVCRNCSTPESTLKRSITVLHITAIVRLWRMERAVLRRKQPKPILIDLFTKILSQVRLEALLDRFTY